MLIELKYYFQTRGLLEYVDTTSYGSSMVAMLKLVMHKNLALMWVASSATPGKFVIKDTRFWRAMKAAINLKLASENKPVSTEQQLRFAMSKVLSNVPRWSKKQNIGGNLTGSVLAVNPQFDTEEEANAFLQDAEIIFDDAE